MARLSISYTGRGATTHRNVRREDGFPLVLMEENATTKLALHWASLLESGETVSSVAASGEGVTVSISTSGSTSTLTLSGATAWGKVIITATLSSGEVIVETIRARLNNRAGYVEVAYAL